MSDKRLRNNHYTYFPPRQWARHEVPVVPERHELRRQYAWLALETAAAIFNSWMLSSPIVPIFCWVFVCTHYTSVWHYRNLRRRRTENGDFNQGSNL